VHRTPPLWGAAYANPLSVSDAARLGFQFRDLLGRLVRPGQITQSGIYLVGTADGNFRKITVIK
jgi:hypothetical protein